MEGFRFRFSQGKRDREVERIAIRRALDLVATFLAPGGNDPSVAEFERLLNEDLELGLNVLYGLAAMFAGLVMQEAEMTGEEPLDVLRGIEEANESDG